MSVRVELVNAQRRVVNTAGKFDILGHTMLLVTTIMTQNPLAANLESGALTILLAIFRSNLTA